MPDLGKQFEAKFKEDFKKSFPDGFLLRLFDVVNGYKSIKNPCDFVGYMSGKLFLLEVKSHKGASLPFDAITQFDDLQMYKDIDGVYPVIICWLYEKDVVFAAPIQTLIRIKDAGESSIGIRHFDSYNIKLLPGVKKRRFIDTDYTNILDIEK